MSANRPSSTLGHVALHYRQQNEAPLVSRLLRALGFIECYSMEQPTGGPFFHFVIDAQANRGTDRILYVMHLPALLGAVYDEIGKKLGVGTPGESPVVTAARAAQADEPEFGFHVAVVMHSLEELENMVLQLRQLVAEDTDLKGRVKITLNRAKPGTPEVDARMDASPLFADTTRHTYGPNGVQVFVETDLLVGGPLGDNWVFEFDYVFPGYADNILNSPSDDAAKIIAGKEIHNT